MQKFIDALERFSSFSFYSCRLAVCDLANEIVDGQIDALEKLGINGLFASDRIQLLQQGLIDCLGWDIRTVANWREEERKGTYELKKLGLELLIYPDDLVNKLLKLQEDSWGILKLIRAIRPELDPEKQKALDLWNLGGKSWSKIAVELGGQPSDGESLRKSTKRYATKTWQYLRKDESRKSIENH